MATKKQKGEAATRNVRIYESTLDTIHVLRIETGKTIPRIIDEMFNPDKYISRE